MIFGYYTVSLKTIQANQLPAEIPVEAGTHFECGLKLAHILFIPIFPMGKQWLLKRDGNSYEVTPEAAQLFDTLYGKPKTPWYAFAGLILAGLALVYFSVQDMIEDRRRMSYLKETKKQQLNEKIKSFENPLVSDFYALEGSNGQYFGVKVDSASEDKVWVRYLINDQGFGFNNQNNTLAPFIVNRGKFSVTTLAKKDVMKSYQDKKALVKIKGLASGQPLKVVDVYNIDIDAKKTKIAIKDPETTVAVKDVLKRFVTQTSMDSSLALMDTSSKVYLLGVVKTALTNDARKMKRFIMTSKNSTVTYAMMMYARYAYLSGKRDKKDESNAKLLRNFGFFSKLIGGVGLWSINDKIKDINVMSVTLTGINKASARLSLYSNILQTRSKIYFSVDLNKENGQWKVNLPSTFSYTSNQVFKVGRFTEGPRLYRERVRTDLKKLDKKNQTVFAPELVY
ncbi:MAG TPA: hypothetical protein DCS93_40485 [Microscillaceae bacterium]|nr:hypothetical protein [Microscillaceae bacterium]